MISTGVAWCDLADTLELRAAALRIREAERSVSGSCDHDESVVRTLVTRRVAKAAQLAADASVTLDDLLDTCLTFRGEPWAEARARRDMRELVRDYRHLRQVPVAMPQSAEDLFALWSEVTVGEVPMYRDAKTPHFRTRIPFARGDDFFEPAPVVPEQETVAIENVPRETRQLLAFVNTREHMLELRAAAALFAFFYIHPFADGNGRTGRLLACTMLSEAYSVSTLVAFVAQLQARRAEQHDCLGPIVRNKADLGPFARLFLDMLEQAQRDVSDIRQLGE